MNQPSVPQIVQEPPVPSNPPMFTLPLPRQLSVTSAPVAPASQPMNIPDKNDTINIISFPPETTASLGDKDVLIDSIPPPVPNVDFPSQPAVPIPANPVLQVYPIPTIESIPQPQVVTPVIVENASSPTTIQPPFVNPLQATYIPPPAPAEVPVSVLPIPLQSVSVQSDSSVQDNSTFIQPPQMYAPPKDLPLNSMSQSIVEPIRPPQVGPLESVPSYFKQLDSPIDLGSIDDFPVNDVDIREALLSLVKTKFFWNKSTAKNMTILNVENYMAYYAKWDTFVDSRSASWKEEPCDKELDTPQIAPPPAPFDIDVQIPPLFTSQTVTLRVPHTDLARDCVRCRTIGTVVCRECHGNGYVPCSYCHASGIYDDHICYSCNGLKQRKCYECDGSGNVTCSKCDGYRVVTAYVEMTVDFSTEEVYADINNQSLPEDELHKSTADVIYIDSDYVIKPPYINDEQFDGPLLSLKKKSDSIILTKPSRILQQRLTIYRVPVHHVTSVIKNEEFSFFVYGTENYCYCPHYAKKFGNCSIF